MENETNQIGWKVAIATRAGKLETRPNARIYTTYREANRYAERLNMRHGAVIAAVVSVR
jgi:hypothetical protein